MERYEQREDRSIDVEKRREEDRYEQKERGKEIWIKVNNYE